MLCGCLLFPPSPLVVLIAADQARGRGELVNVGAGLAQKKSGAQHQHMAAGAPPTVLSQARCNVIVLVLRPPPRCRGARRRGGEPGPDSCHPIGLGVSIAWPPINCHVPHTNRCTSRRSCRCRCPPSIQPRRLGQCIIVRKLDRFHLGKQKHETRSMYRSPLTPNTAMPFHV